MDIVIPEFNSYGGCPKCRLPTEDTTAGLLVSAVYHSTPTEGEACHGLLLSLTAEQEEELEFDEHLCRTCTRCHFSWVERVVRAGSVYAELRPAHEDEPDEYEHCGCDHHGDHEGCDDSCRERGCVR